MLVKIDRMFKINFIALNESRMIQLQFATNWIKIGPLEPEIQPAKVRDVIKRWAYDVTWRHQPTALAGNNITCNTLQLLFDKKFQTLSYHTDVVRVWCLSYIAPPVMLSGCASYVQFMNKRRSLFSANKIEAI